MSPMMPAISLPSPERPALTYTLHDNGSANSPCSPFLDSPDAPPPFDSPSPAGGFDSPDDMAVELEGPTQGLPFPSCNSYPFFHQGSFVMPKPLQTEMYSVSNPSGSPDLELNTGTTQALKPRTRSRSLSFHL